MDRKPYPTDVSDLEWAFLAPYLTLMTPDAPQRKHDLREVFNALHYIVRAGCAWRLLPTNFPDWEVVYQRTQRWIAAGVFEDIVHDLRVLLRLAMDKDWQPTAAIIDSRTLISTVESGHRAGYDGAKCGYDLSIVIPVISGGEYDFTLLPTKVREFGKLMWALPQIW